MPVRLTAKRRIAQAVSLVLLNSNFAPASVFGLRLAQGCLPVMNCEACAVAWLGCPIGIIGRAVGFRVVPWLALGLTLGVAVLIGRFFCGWICPMGFLQDLLHKIPSRKWRLPRWTGAIKYVVLAVTVFGVAWYLGYDSSFFYCRICPTAGLQVVLPIMVQDGRWLPDPANAVKMALTAAVLVFGVLIHRSFCKVMCPVGAMVAIGNRLTPLRLKLDGHACIGCRQCDRACAMDVPVMRHREGSQPISRNLECISCLACKQVCPVKAIGYKAGAGKREEHANESHA